MTKEVKNERIYGMDFMRVLSMFMVLVLHVLYRGGILDNVSPDTPQYYVAWIMELLSYCAVNCFALASGYLVYERKIKYRKLAYMWLTVLFYNALSFIIDLIFIRGGLNAEHIRLLFPVLSRQYWYFTAYFALLLFLPFINKLISVMTKRAHYTLITVGFFLLSICEMPMFADTFSTNEGYSVWWITYLYFVGAAIKKYDVGRNLKKGSALLLFFASSMLAFLAKAAIAVAAVFDLGIIGRIINKLAPGFISYVSPFIIFAAVFLMLFCIKLKLNGGIGRLLSKIQPLVFQVYVIHLNYVVWDYFLKDRFVKYGENALLLPFLVLGTALVMFIALLFIDWLRSLLFKLLRINDMVNAVSDKLAGSSGISRIKRNFLKLLDKNIGI